VSFTQILEARYVAFVLKRVGCIVMVLTVWRSPFTESTAATWPLLTPSINNQFATRQGIEDVISRFHAEIHGYAWRKEVNLHLKSVLENIPSWYSISLDG